MTIEYKDSKRIVGLSTDMSSNIVTINHRLSNDDDTAYADLGSALSNSSWVMRYKMVISGYSASSSNPNNSYLFALSKTNTDEQDTQSLGFKLQIGGVGGSVAKVSGGTSSQNTGEGYSGADFTTTVANATWYIECIRNGADFSVRITTNSDYTGGENKTWSTSGTVEDLRYIKYTNRHNTTSSWVLVSTISDIKIYDGVTSATGTFVRDGTWTASASNKVTVATQDIKPTDIQDNSILVEKDTARRYWFSKPTVVDDDLSNNEGWQSNTSAWTYNASGDYLDFATITRSTTAQQIYIDVQDSAYLGSGNNLSDSEWTARFKIRTGTQSSSTGNVLFYFGFSNNLGDSGTTQQTVTMKMNFNGQANENNMTLSVSRVNFENTSPPARVNSDVYANTNLPYSTDLYMEMTRNGDVFTLKAYSDEYVTQASSTSVASVTVTGISGLQYIKAFNDSEQSQSYTSGGARLYDMEITNGSATWTYQAKAKTPAQIGNLKVHYDATVGVTASSNSVSAWADQSGNGKTLSSVSNPTRVVAGLNGKDYLDFNSAKSMRATGLSETAPRPFTMVAVINPRNGGSQAIIRWSQNNYLALYQNPANTYYMSGGTELNLTDSTLDGSWNAFFMDFKSNADGGTLQINLDTANAVSGTLGSNGTSGTTATLHVGINADNNNWQGSCRYAEIIIFDNVLTAFEKEDLYEHLKTKWGLP